MSRARRALASANPSTTGPPPLPPEPRPPEDPRPPPPAEPELLPCPGAELLPAVGVEALEVHAVVDDRHPLRRSSEQTLDLGLDQAGDGPDLPRSVQRKDATFQPHDRSMVRINSRPSAAHGREGAPGRAP